MASRSLLLAIILLTAGLAGCVGGDDDSDVEPTAGDAGLDEPATNETNRTEADPEPVVTSTWKNATIEGAGFPTGGNYCLPGCDNNLEFEVPSGANAVVVEAAWEASAEMRLNVTGPNCDSFAVLFEFCSPGAQATGSSPLKVVLAEDKNPGNNSGTWDAEIWVESATPTTAEPTMVASVVEEGELPRQFSKLDGTSSSDGS